jgi:hypothetical protein
MVSVPVRSVHNIHPAEILDGREPLDDDLCVCPSPRRPWRHTVMIIGSISGVEAHRDGASAKKKRLRPAALGEPARSRTPAAPSPL